MNLGLDQETTDSKIIKILTDLAPCECEDGPCECKLHHLDVGAIRSNIDFMAVVILDEFNKVLDERLQNKLGVQLVKKTKMKNKSVETEDLPSPVATPEKFACNICKFQPCVCRVKIA